MKLGQIQIHSLAGQTIINTCLREDVNTIVEIGTWNGMGSTRCICEATKNTDKKAISIEIDIEKYKEAIQNIDSANIKLIYGKITNEYLSLDNLPDIFFTDYPIDIKKTWLYKDINNILTAPDVIEFLPEKIDFLILDGGEFTSNQEYLLLKSRSKYIFLDDTKPPAVKNYYSRLDMIKNHITLVDNQTDRHGFYLGKINNLE